jgi:heat shock protein HslJ
MRRELVCIGLLAMALAGCAAVGGGGGDALDGTAWRLIGIDGRPPLAGSQVTAAFAAGQVSGGGGCNSYGGSVQAVDGRLTVRDLASTAMACLTPPGVMEQEAVVLGLLVAAERYELSGGRLVIFSALGQTLAFEPQG